MTVLPKTIPFLLFVVGVSAALGITVCLTKKFKRKYTEDNIMELILSKLIEMPDFQNTASKEKVEEEINELKMMLDISRCKEWAEGSRIDYFNFDVIEMAQDVVGLKDVLDLNKDEDLLTFYKEVEPIKIWLVQAFMTVLPRILFGTGTVCPINNVAEGDDDDVVQLEKDVQQLLRRSVLNKEAGLYITSIRGMVGSGKTTFVRQVYSHATVVERFERRAWVSVSNELTHKEVLMSLVKQVVDSEELHKYSLLEKMHNRSLRQIIYQHLQGMRYLVVLDGMPKAMRLKCFLKALPHEERGSRLLLLCTSMNYRRMSIIHDAIVMEPLDSDKTWQLFWKTISKITSEEVFPKELEKKGREMLKKCGGLPLAIKIVGRQLAEKRLSGIEWDQILESIDWGATLESLEPVYLKLVSPELKLCFLHLAFFKENANMREEKLIQIWAAGGIGSEDKCASHLITLISESVLTSGEQFIGYPVKSYCINAILHMLSIKKAEEKGFEILRNCGIHPPSRSSHHRVVICSREKFNYSMNQDEHIVSLFFQGGGYFEATQFYWKCFEQLKILDFKDFGLKILPESIGTLTELKYLGLRNNYIRELPVSLRWLKKLEVLDIAKNFMVEVRHCILEMSSLRHLYTSDAIFQMPLKISALQNLETLTYISADNCTCELSGLQMMTRLKKLGIKELGENTDVGKLFASLAELENLSCLILRGFRFRSMPCLYELQFPPRLTRLTLDGFLPRLPIASNFPPNLCNLKLINTRLDQDPMLVLKKLPKLVHLKLQNAYTGQEMVIMNDGFPKLKVLLIQELWSLRNVRVGKGAMPALEALVIDSCPFLETLPEEIESMNAFKDLQMVTTKKIARKIRKLALISNIKGVDING